MTGFVSLPVWLVVVWYLVSGFITLVLFEDSNCFDGKNKFYRVIEFICVFFCWPLYCAIIIIVYLFLLIAKYIEMIIEKGDKY